LRIALFLKTPDPQQALSHGGEHSGAMPPNFLFSPNFVVFRKLFINIYSKDKNLAP